MSIIVQAAVSNWQYCIPAGDGSHLIMHRTIGLTGTIGP